ncbi:class I SAM-dependent methyltransferase [Caulobacter sp. NIBR2454]|uniref:class I SAM-dependent methyltransferase n=1 Tax=Caulobacter sp. NIBR2454 TaxID=3015996 RepID=UPI0022B659B5|nr:class I SAM-dependent methyltransferase [Caulobacter sp. NIBR2454]
MSTWNEGYTTDVQYTSFFHAELAPSHIAFAAAANGFRAPDMSGAFAYCELGSGQGVTLNGLAAMHPEARFWGFDFNPAQIANAQRMADAAKLANAHFRDWSFAQAIEHADELPRFDVIALHGILSWVSDENRAEIIRFIDRTLKPGGVVYASYNCLPGWTQIAPYRHLARQHYLRHPGRSDLHVPRILEFSDAFAELGGAYFKVNPTVSLRLDQMRKQPAAYFAHEFLNANWRAFYVDEIAREMSGARLDFMASATLIENVPGASLPPGTPAFLQQHAAEDVIWQELAKDFACNKMFRRDLYARGVNTMSGPEQAAILGGFRFVLTVPREAVKLTFAGPMGEANGAPAVYEPIVDRLMQGPATLPELVAALPDKNGPNALQAITMLLHSRQAVMYAAKVDPKPARALNKVIAESYFQGSNYGIILAPAARQALPANGADLGLLAAALEGKARSVAEAAAHVSDRLRIAGRAPQVDGQALQGAAAVEHLAAQYAEGFDGKMTIWKALGIL